MVDIKLIKNEADNDSAMERIDILMDAEIAELQARIAAEQSMIANEQTKLQLYAMVSEAEARVQAQRLKEIQAKTWAARGKSDLTPLTFE